MGINLENLMIKEKKEQDEFRPAKDTGHTGKTKTRISSKSAKNKRIGTQTLHIATHKKGYDEGKKKRMIQILPNTKLIETE